LSPSISYQQHVSFIFSRKGQRRIIIFINKKEEEKEKKKNSGHAFGSLSSFIIMAQLCGKKRNDEEEGKRKLRT